jgi:hypothetical protein
MRLELILDSYKIKNTPIFHHLVDKRIIALTNTLTFNLAYLAADFIADKNLYSLYGWEN